MSRANSPEPDIEPEYEHDLVGIYDALLVCDKSMLTRCPTEVCETFNNIVFEYPLRLPSQIRELLSAWNSLCTWSRNLRRLVDAADDVHELKKLTPLLLFLEDLGVGDSERWAVWKRISNY